MLAVQDDSEPSAIAPMFQEAGWRKGAKGAHKEGSGICQGHVLPLLSHWLELVTWPQVAAREIRSVVLAVGSHVLS